MFYILYGENAVMLDNFIEELMKSKDISDKIVYDYSECNIKDVIEECSYNDLFGSKKMVVLDNSVFLTSKGSLEDKTFDSYISSPNENTVLVFKVICEKLDERKKLVRDLKSKSIVKEFKDLDKTNINGYINSYFTNLGYKIDYNAVSEIISRIGETRRVLYSELEKLELYKIKDKHITIEDVKKVVTKYDEDNIFKLVDAVIQKNKKLIFNTYKKLVSDKEEPAVIISLLANNIMLILECSILLNEGMSSKDIASKLKEHPYRVSLAINNSYKVKKEELIDNLNKLAELDYQIKTGEVDKFKGLEAYFINL